MAKTKIEWATHTWNPITGCSPVSEGCQNCYAARIAKRLAGKAGYPKDDPFRVTLHPERLREPLRWRKPRNVFVVSMGDLFHEDVPEKWFSDIYAIIMESKRLRLGHTFIILTKRPKRMAELIRPKEPLTNLWLGVTAENQQRADERIPILLQIPAAVRFVSVEPMLEPVDLNQLIIPGNNPMEYHISALHEQHDDCLYESPTQLDWVICGGESGPGARPMHPDWARSLRDQCQTAGTPFFFKQWGEFAPAHLLEPHIKIDFDDGALHCMRKVGKKRAGRLLDGKIWDQFPKKRKGDATQ